MADLIDIKDRAPNRALIAEIERVLQFAKEGQIRSLLMVHGWDDDHTSHAWVMDPRSNRRMMLAEIVLCQHDHADNIMIADGDGALARILFGKD